MTDPTEPAPDIPEPGGSQTAPPDTAPPDTAPPDTRPAAATAPARPRRQRGGLMAVVALTVLGLIGVLGGGAALGRELTRKATKAEQAAALATEIASRWQRLPAGTIFPATLSYFNAAGEVTTATLVAIAPRTSCEQALEAGTSGQVHALGCAAMLRATYVDAAGAQATTVGVAVMRSPAAAQRAQQDLDPMKAGSGLHTVPVSGTIASLFGDAQRGADGAEIAGPYLLLFTAGYTDGIPGPDVTDTDELVALGSGVLARVQKTLTRHPAPCAMKDVQC